MCEHCATSELCPYTCPQQIKKNPVKSFIMEVVFLTVLLIPEMLLARLTKMRVKKSLIEQWNAMPPERQLFYYKLNQFLAHNQMPVEKLPEEQRGGLTDY